MICTSTVSLVVRPACWLKFHGGRYSPDALVNGIEGHASTSTALPIRLSARNCTCNCYTSSYALTRQICQHVLLIGAFLNYGKN